MFPSPNRSPDQSPTPSVMGRSVSEGPPRRSASEPCLRPITPARSQRSLEPADQTEDPEKPTSSSREELIDQAVEQVPLNLARVVVNMQEYYASELEAERQRTEELAGQNEQMMKKMSDMEKRLQMHVVLMDGFVSFMREAKEGAFAFSGSAELDIAKSFGGEHLEEVQALVSNNYSTIKPSVEQPSFSEDIAFDPEDEEQTTSQSMQEDGPFGGEIFDQLPPTPDMDVAPVRSTGRRAPKRRNPPTRPHREVKRRTRANLRNVRLRDTASWTPINAGRNAQQPSVDADADSADEQLGDGNDLDYTPDPEDEGHAPSNAPVSPSTSLSPFPSDDENHKPRYSVPRSVGYRYAAGPPGRRFKYHRMPKTVALVWQEWKHGSHGNPSIEALEKRYNTTWRMGSLQERKYASNYVGVRQKVVRKVEEMCEEEGMSVEEACEKLDERIDGRMQLLMTALRKGEDPLMVIPKKKR
ncbi:hypothetical protein FSARC_1815 [Fusarium sarcochroum]|uniref:Transcription activator GCR1-like domain-containing protein n=1 Tax=Fusarium sarcochroum TaxID=1208366 RepID=A0A8H4XEI2_9HYPO|nr:hypothetical protein FSARC_1815 [Fusarium sarcochroum]